jgi:DNA-binding transcriptional LysR family regulator
MTESQVRAFIAVAECGSFGEASRRLHLSQPGVSRAVQSLEGELGAPLLVRGRGFVSLTPLGERALVRGRTIVAEADAMRQELDEQRGIASGRVRLGSMPSVSAAVLPGLLAQLERRHPALTVTVLDGHDDELVAWARDGMVDLAVVAAEHAALEQQPLLTDEFFAVLPADHALAERPSVDPRALADEPFILTQAGCEGLVLSALAAAGVVPNVRYQVTEASSILAMVDEGLGVSIMPGLAAQDRPSSVVLRPLRPRAERRLSLAYAPRQALSPACNAFLTEAAAWTTRRGQSASQAAKLS